jgi:hypothetical protein
MDTSQYPPGDYRRRFVYNYSTPYRDETLVKLNSVKNKLRKL